MSNVQILAIVVGSVVGFGLLVDFALYQSSGDGVVFYFLLHKHDEWKRHKSNIPYLSFEEFEKYYWLNPNSWKLNDYCVTKYFRNKEGKIEADDVWERLGNGLYKSSRSNSFSYQFTFRDYKKYLKFTKHLEDLKEQKRQEEQNATNQQQYIRLLEEVQKDIDALKEQAADEWEQGVEMVEKVIKNIK